MENYVEVAHTKGKKVTVKDSLGVERDSIIKTTTIATRVTGKLLTTTRIILFPTT